MHGGKALACCNVLLELNDVGYISKDSKVIIEGKKKKKKRMQGAHPRAGVHLRAGVAPARMGPTCSKKTIRRAQIKFRHMQRSDLAAHTAPDLAAREY